MAQQFRLVKCYNLPSNMYLVGGLEHEFYVPFHIWDVIFPIDERIFFKMVIAPPTRYSLIFLDVLVLSSEISMIVDHPMDNYHL